MRFRSKPARFGCVVALFLMSSLAATSQTVTLTPATLAFGSQVLNTTAAPRKITLKNGLGTPLTITSVTSSLVDFADTSACPISPATLRAGASCLISVTFTPSVLGARSGSLTIVDNASNSPQVTKLTGTGVAAVSLIPSTISFGSQAPGTTSAASKVTVKNNQPSALTISSIATSLSDFQDTTTCPLTPSTLAAGGTCTISVIFDPSVLGSRAATLSITDSANNSPQIVSLSGKGTAAVLTSIAGTPNPASMALGTTQQFTATGTYSNNTTQNLTKSVGWTSSSPLVASISSGGLATSTGQGSAIISAVSGTISGSATLQVTPPLLVGLSVSPTSASIALGTSQQFTATGTYGDGSTQNLTSSVTWTSSFPTVATVNTSGLAASLSQGSTTVTASTGTFNASGTLSVGQPVLTSIALTPANPSFALGTTQILKATGTYSDGSTLDLTSTATWSSNSPGIATVYSQGVLTSVATGTSNITASVGSISGATIVTVTPAALVSIAVTPAIPVIPLSSTQPFTATGTYTDGTTQNITDTVQWTSDTTTVAIVSNQTGTQGQATAVGPGTATISAISGGVTGSTVLTVATATLVSIAVTPATLSIALGTTQQFTATGTYSDGSTQNLTTTATWSSDTVSVATINSAGLSNGIGTGTANISATSGSVAGSTLLTITPATLVSIAITPPLPSIAAGTNQQFAATGTFTDGSTQDLTQSAYWSSSPASVAAISDASGSQGLATALTVGTTTISVAYETVSGTATLTVTPAMLVSIAVNPQSASIALGTTQQFTAAGTYSDGSIQDLTGTVVWNSSLAAVAIVSNTTGASGLATSAGQGTTGISATLGQISGSALLTVGTPALVSIAVSPANVSIALGTTQQFTATGTFTDGSTQDLTQSGYWSSSVPSVVTISDSSGSQGQAMAVSGGSTVISVVSCNLTGTADLTVSSIVLVSIAINPQAAAIALGTTQQFTATGTYSDGSTQDLTSAVVWSSTSNQVATIANIPATPGLATSVGEGLTIVSATLGQVSSSVQLTVGQPSLVSILIAPTNVSMALGTTQQFTATGSYSDGSTQNLTSSVSWSSNAPSVASIATSGLASGVGLGSTTITAMSSNITNTTQVTVTAPMLVSLSISPATASIPVLSSQQYSATGTYTDGSTQNLTNSVTWTSSTPSVATITSAGLTSSGSAGTVTISAGLGSINASSSLSVGVGSVTGITSVPCGSGFAPNSRCSQATISCPGTSNQQFTYGVEQGTGAGTIVIYNGAAGITAGGSNYVASFNSSGFTTVQVAWATGWQDTGLATKNILTAACRPASVGQFVYANYYSTGGYGVLGGSAGAGAVGYWLAWYGGGDIIDNVELASGPVYSDIEQGCEVPGANSLTIVPTDGTPWADTINFRGGTQNGLTTETGYTCRPSTGNTSTTANAAWLAQSTIQPGWTSSYPNTNVSGWVCNNAQNNSEAEAWLFFSQLTSPFLLTAVTGCTDSETVDGGYTPQGVLGSTAITNDMLAQCFKRHSN